MLVAQFALLFFVGRQQVPLLACLGYAIWAGGLVFAWFPIAYLRRKAGVAKGRSYVHTTRVVTTGIYSVVRHPQYLSYFMFALALALIGQHWVIVLLGAAGSGVFCLGLRGVDRHNIEKFGDEYRKYKAEVPAYNILLGLVRRMTRRRRG